MYADTVSALLFLEGKMQVNKQFVDDIIGYSDDALEREHWYIQWLFPTNEESYHNMKAPVIDPEDLLHSDLVEVHNTGYYDKAFKRMLEFYGLKYVSFLGRSFVVPRIKFFYKTWWSTKGDHNHLRLTRIVKSLYLFQRREESVALITFLVRLTELNPGGFSEKTCRIWQDLYEDLTSC